MVMSDVLLTYHSFKTYRSFKWTMLRWKGKVIANLDFSNNLLKWYFDLEPKSLSLSLSLSLYIYIYIYITVYYWINGKNVPKYPKIWATTELIFVVFPNSCIFQSLLCLLNSSFLLRNNSRNKGAVADSFSCKLF